MEPRGARHRLRHLATAHRRRGLERRPAAASTTLERQRTYVLYGATEDNSWSTTDVSFTLAHLAALTPGRVRYFGGEVPGADDDGYLTASIEDFRADACEDD